MWPVIWCAEWTVTVKNRSVCHFSGSFTQAPYLLSSDTLLSILWHNAAPVSLNSWRCRFPSANCGSFVRLNSASDLLLANNTSFSASKSLICKQMQHNKSQSSTVTPHNTHTHTHKSNLYSTLMSKVYGTVWVKSLMQNNYIRCTARIWFSQKGE